MAYKVICNRCNQTVRVKIEGKSWFASCKCLLYCLDDLNPDTWKVQELGVIPINDKLKYCSGCYENIYNNTVGVKECWNLKSAKLVMKKKVGLNDVPPWNHIPIKCLSCYHETGYVMISSEDKRSK